MGESVRYVHTEDYVGILKDLVQDEHTVTVPVAGNSMSPFLISGRDIVLFQKPDRSLRRGDIVFYQRDSGEYILHRICRIDGNKYYIIGDAQISVEGPVRDEQIFGLVTKIRRKGEWIDSNDFWWRFFEKVWIRIIPLRPLARKVYSILR